MYGSKAHLLQLHEQQHILFILKNKIPVNQGVAVLTSSLLTLQTYIADSLATSNEPIDEWVEVEDMDGDWDVVPETERILAKQKHLESLKTKNQFMRELLENERKRQLEGQFDSYSDADRSAFIGQTKAIDDLRPLFNNATEPEVDYRDSFLG